MGIVFGLALLGLVTLYTSTVTFVLRGYSRPRLSRLLDSQRHWLEWLERHENELLVLGGLVRLTAILVAVVWIFFEFVLGELPGAAIWKYGLAAAVSFLFVLVLALVIPNAIALYVGESVLARNLRALALIRWVLFPVGRTVIWTERAIRSFLGRQENEAAEESERLEQDILEAVNEGELAGAVDPVQKEIIQGLFDLHETTVSAIMTPRTEVVAIPVDASYAHVIDVVRTSAHSRIPVYEESIDRVIGVLYAKDLLGAAESPFDLRKMLRNVPFVPETKTIDRLLIEFRQSKVHIAIVIDEYGGTAGVVTFEDVLEELLGEISDEYDSPEPPGIRRIDANTLEVDARTHVHEINAELNVSLPEGGDYETIGGFVFTSLGKIPEPGEKFTHENIHFHITDAEPRKINRLRIRVERQAQPA